MERKIAKVLLTTDEIRQKVDEMGRLISTDYTGKDLLVLGILKGAVVFMSDLIRHITIPVKVDFMAVSSYGLSTQSSGAVRIMYDPEQSMEGRHILVVEDIIDTGLTLSYLVDNLKSRRAASVKVCTFLDKPSRRRVLLQPDYNGFSIPDEFVVGYGLDYAEQYRHLPYVAVLKPEVYA